LIDTICVGLFRPGIGSVGRRFAVGIDFYASTTFLHAGNARTVTLPSFVAFPIQIEALRWRGDP
jgi:hypothetical protein